jgi:SAM-dependent methyltransferase
MNTRHYDGGFFDLTTPGATSSARSIVPIVIELVRPQSVVDVGCGLGAWLQVFQEQGVRDVMGVDGGYVVREDLLIEQGAFVAHDLELPLDLDRRFDLAVSLEVAEHLSAKAAPVFVESLVRLAPTVLFSAAIPGQGGVDHRNEQWPQYWAALFRGHGYEPVDWIRPRVWRDSAVEVWYAQNTVLYTANSELRRQAASLAAHRDESWLPLAVVHPRLFTAALRDGPRCLTTRELVHLLPAALRRTIAWRLARR